MLGEILFGTALALAIGAPSASRGIGTLLGRRKWRGPKYRLGDDVAGPDPGWSRWEGARREVRGAPRNSILAFPGIEKHPPIVRALLLDIAEEIGMPVDSLCATIFHESGFNEKAINRDKDGNTVAVGLIQLTAGGKLAGFLGKDLERATKLGAEEQVRLIVGPFYRRGHSKAGLHPGEALMENFLPSFRGKPEDFVLAREGDAVFAQNRGFAGAAGGDPATIVIADVYEHARRSCAAAKGRRIAVEGTILILDSTGKAIIQPSGDATNRTPSGWRSPKPRPISPPAPPALPPAPPARNAGDVARDMIPDPPPWMQGRGGDSAPKALPAPRGASPGPQKTEQYTLGLPNADPPVAPDYAKQFTLGVPPPPAPPPELLNAPPEKITAMTSGSPVPDLRGADPNQLKVSGWPIHPDARTAGAEVDDFWAHLRVAGAPANGDLGAPDAPEERGDFWAHLRVAGPSSVHGLMLNAVRDGTIEQPVWRLLEVPALGVEVVVLDRPLRAKVDGRWLMLGVSYADLVQICRKLGTLPPTAEIVDAAWAAAKAAGTVIQPIGLVQTADDFQRMASVAFAIKHNDNVEKAVARLAGEDVFFRDAGKDWTLDPSMARPDAKGVVRGVAEYGMRQPNGTPIQGMGPGGHDPNYVDYSMICANIVQRDATDLRTGAKVDLLDVYDRHFAAIPEMGPYLGVFR